MKHRSLQWMPSRSRFARARSLLLHWCCGAILLTGLWGAGWGLPAIAQANSIMVKHQATVLAVTPVKPAVQLPATVATRLRQALSKQTRIPAAKLKLVEATAKTWADGCLGLAKADELCTEALVVGWRVVFSDGKQRWVYRCDKQARVYRLES